jgi:hypothetical protein
MKLIITDRTKENTENVKQQEKSKKEEKDEIKPTINYC